MPKKVRKKTKAELADPSFRKRSLSQSDVLIRADAECEKLSQSRRQHIRDVANSAWIGRFENRDDDVAFAQERKRWAQLQREFLQSTSKPIEIHCFTCNYNADKGLKPLIQLVKNPWCDAGTALRLFWINDPVYYSQYGTISECTNDDEQDAMKLLSVITRRFKTDDFKSSKVYFDPQPWIDADDVDLEVLNLPSSMLVAVP